MLMTRIVKIKKRPFMKSIFAINLFGIIITYEEPSKMDLAHHGVAKLCLTVVIDAFSLMMVWPFKRLKGELTCRTAQLG